MKFKNLLIISNSFPDKENKYISNIFVKEQLIGLKNYFDNVYVIIPVAYGIEYLRKTKHENYEFDNVKVYFPKHFNFPLFYFSGRSIWVELEKRAILRLIQKEDLKFNLIHAHFTWPSGAVAVELKKRFEVPVVITEHTHITLYQELKLKNKYYTKTWDLCDAIIRVNKKDIHLFVEAGVPPNRVFYVANGYSPKKFRAISINEARERLGLVGSKKIILHISRLSKEKGQKYLIEAMKKILAHQKDVLLFIGGSGPLKNKLELQIKDLNLQDHVKLIGFIPDELMPIWMNTCDLFVLSSLNEGNPSVMFEALGCGKPFVGTKVGGIPEIIINDKLGILVEPKDPEELAQAILQALETEWHEEYIREYAEQFTWDRIAKMILEVYEKVME